MKKVLFDQWAPAVPEPPLVSSSPPGTVWHWKWSRAAATTRGVTM